jgi:predicted chitinase
VLNRDNEAFEHLGAGVLGRRLLFISPFSLLKFDDFLMDADRIPGLNAEFRALLRLDWSNDVAGDGKRFMGRGPIQTTGRANYTRVAKALQIDCVNHPELLSTPEHGFRAAALFWQDNECNEFADKDDFLAVSQLVNCGRKGMLKGIIPNGFDDRKKKLVKAKQALGLQ